MATLFKPTRPHPLPADAEIIDRDGKPHVRIREKGKTVFYPLSDDRTQYLKPTAKWAADVRFEDGTRKRVRFSPNKDAAALMLSELLTRQGRCFGDHHLAGLIANRDRPKHLAHLSCRVNTQADREREGRGGGSIRGTPKTSALSAGG